MMKTALIAKLCLNTEVGGPTYFEQMLNLPNIKHSEFGMIELAITPEMLQDPEFITWFTNKIMEWERPGTSDKRIWTNGTTIRLSKWLWKDLHAYFPPNGHFLLSKLYTSEEEPAFSTRKSTSPSEPFRFTNSEINRWNEHIFQLGDVPKDEYLLPNMMKSLIQEPNQDTFEFIQLNRQDIPFLSSYLIASATKFGMHYAIDIANRFLIEYENNIFEILQFLLLWKGSLSQRYILFRDKFIQSLDPIYQQVFFSSKECWWDNELICDSCKEENWQHFLPQYRCIAVCSEKNGQCMRFAKPYSDFCLYHMEHQPNEMKKRMCKDPCPESNKQISYHENPFAIPSQLALYPKTARPVSELPQYNPHQDWIENEWYLPCVRYDSLYYSGHEEKKDAQYCGKFFYYEPESSTAIRLGKSLFCATKVQAWLRLEFLVNGSQLQRKTRKDQEFPQFLQHAKYNSALFQMDLNPDTIFYRLQSMLTNHCKLGNPTNYWDRWLTFHFSTLFLSLEETFDCVDDICIPLFFPSVQPDVPFFDSFVGSFDFLDQPICNLARQFGLDTVVFQHEVGSHDCVTEIMHINNQSFQKDLFHIGTEKNPITTLKGQSILPKIWFPKDDGILTFQTGHILHLPLIDPTLVFRDYESAIPRKKYGSGYMRDAVHEFKPRIPKRKDVFIHT